MAIMSTVDNASLVSLVLQITFYVCYLIVLYARPMHTSCTADASNQIIRLSVIPQTLLYCGNSIGNSQTPTFLRVSSSCFLLVVAFCAYHSLVSNNIVIGSWLWLVSSNMTTRSS